MITVKITITETILILEIKTLTLKITFDEILELSKSW